MSKYIRTSYGIYEVSDVSYNEDIGMNQYISTDGDLIDSVEVVEEADTIEELFDERVWTRYFEETKYLHHEVLPEKQWDMMSISVVASLANGITDCNCYGAIWTDKGLIYVAKINEQGEWVLL